VTGTKSFAMEGGILKIGGSTSYYFSCVNNTGKFRISYVQIQFVSSLGSFIYVEGGSVIFEYLKMNNVQSYWVNPLIDVDHKVASVSVECHSLNITNCKYNYPGGTYNKSSVVFFSNESSATYNIFFNMTMSFFNNNTFNLSSIDYNDGGGICGFNSLVSSSGFFLFFLF
jgi:hypothetical protein